MSDPTAIYEITKPVLPLTATLTRFASEQMYVTPSERALLKKLRGLHGRCVVEVDVVNGEPRGIERIIHEVAF